MSGTWTDVLYGANGILGTVDGTEAANPIYRIGNHLSTTTQTADISGSVLGGASVLPFGQIQSNTTTDRFIYTNHEIDSENSSFYTRFRQYSPLEGRWLAPDPYAGSYDLENPQSLNRYSYAMNSPLTAIDVLGMDACLVGAGYSTCVPIGAGFGGGGGDEPGGTTDPWGYTFGKRSPLVSEGIAPNQIPGDFEDRQKFRYGGAGSEGSADNPCLPKEVKSTIGGLFDIALGVGKIGFGIAAIGETGPLGVYVAYNGLLNVISGAAELGGAASGHQEAGENIAKRADAASTISGLITWKVTHSPEKGATASAIEGIGLTAFTGGLASQGRLPMPELPELGIDALDNGAGIGGLLGLGCHF